MSSSPNDPILLTLDGPIAIITLNLPRKLNALTGDLYRQLGYTLRRVAAMPEITITLLTGNGRFFSAGADVSPLGSLSSSGSPSPDSLDADSKRTFWLRSFAANNIELTTAFHTHPKILISALNGPCIGLSAAIISHSDFIYATSTTFLLTPFTSLGLVAEGGSSYTFVRRLGLSLANEALILSKPLSAETLLQCGFLNKVYPHSPKDPSDASGFQKQVLEDVKREFLERGLNKESMLAVKALVRGSWEGKDGLAEVNVKEAFGGLERFLSGAPQREFEAIKSGEKRHKL